jgi:addiction module RelE/StbE family toxin
MKTEVSYTPSFIRALKRLLRTNPALHSTYEEKLSLFISDPFNPLLRTHKLHGKLSGMWSFSLTSNLRILFRFTNKNKAVFFDVGNHDDLY